MKQINYLLLLLLQLPIFSSAQVVINEVMVKPGTNATNPQFQTLKQCTQPLYGNEYIELYNPNSCSPVDISCYVIGFNGNFLSTDHGTFRFPAGSVIPPLSFLSIGGPNSGATINLFNYCSTPNLSTGADRWFIPNGDGYVILWDDSGTPTDAVYWTASSGEAGKWGTDSDIQLAPSFIASGTGCPNVASLQGPQNIPVASSFVYYAGLAPSMGLVIHRTVDGGATWATNAAPTINNCNGICNPAGSTFSVDTASSNATCGGNNGTATATPAPVGTYTYLWSANAGNQTTQTATGLATGTYFVTVADTSGCTVVDTAIVANSGGPTVTASATAATCGLNNGTATATPLGGTTPYNYLWNTGAQTQNIASLQSGNYSVTVTDNSGCIIVTSVTVPGSPAVLVTVTPETCSQSDGQATANVSGGTTPYNYLWSVNTGNQTTQTATGLSSGNYSVTITDNASCTANATATITGGPTLAITANPSFCGNNDGNATAYISGGATPYTYLWSNTETSSTITGLSVGNYSVTVTDANFCTAVSAENVGNIDGPTLTTTSSPATCGNNNGSATVTASGGTSSYTYLWNTGGTTSSLFNLPASNYSVTVTDDNNCTAAETVIVAQTSASVNTVSASICGGDSVFLQGNFQTTTGTYYDTLVSVNGCDSIVETTLTVNQSAISNVQLAICSNDSVFLQGNFQTTSGNYYDTLVSVLGCDSVITTTTLTVNPMPTVTVSDDTTIAYGSSAQLTAAAVPQGGAFLWSTNETTASVTVSPTETTTYYVTVTNAGGCVAVSSVKVMVNVSECNVYVPSLFTPNGDRVNEIYYVRGRGFTEMKFMIYDRWGEQVFQSNNINNGWDGAYKNKGEKMNTAVFVYYFETTCINGEPLREQGNITLIK